MGVRDKIKKVNESEKVRDHNLRTKADEINKKQKEEKKQTKKETQS